MDHATGRPARASLVIPAHQEESVIARCLSAVATAPGAEGLEVAVVANGCHDRTAEVARGFAERLPGLVVVERDQPGKIGALNAGDGVVSAYPRIYLDADIELGAGALSALIETLSTDEPRVAAPHIAFDLSASSALVRAFYRVFARLPYVSDALVGLGVYGLSRTGRQRFETFPDVIADDLYVERLFAPSERRQSSGSFTVRAPRTLAGLLAVRTRVARGNAQLTRERDHLDPAQAAASTGSTVRALVGVLAHRPTALLDVGVYVAVTAAARARARRSTDPWLRDDSTR